MRNGNQKKVFGVFPQEGVKVLDMSRITEGLAAAKRKAELRAEEVKRRSTTTVEFETNAYCSCGGAIVLKSSMKFIQTGPTMLGGPTRGYYQETQKFSCTTCAHSYDGSHSRFAEAQQKLAEMRRPPNNDWVHEE